MPSNSVSLHRVLKSTPEKVFRAFSEPGAYASWLPPYGFFATVQEMDFRVGGRYKMSFTNFSTGHTQSFGGAFLEIQPNERIKVTDVFDDPGLPGQMITTIALRSVMGMTDLHITQEGIPDAIPAEMCYLGWQESLDKLMRLVEPNIPDGAGG